MIKNINQKRILFADTGVDSWNSAIVARAILRRISKQETIKINRFDIEVINRMAQVLGKGRRMGNLFQSGIWTQTMEIPTTDILSIFE